MTYRTHQRRLLPLADTYALHFAQERLVAALADVSARRASAAASWRPWPRA